MNKIAGNPVMAEELGIAVVNNSKEPEYKNNMGKEAFRNGTSSAMRIVQSHPIGRLPADTLAGLR